MIDIIFLIFLFTLSLFSDSNVIKYIVKDGDTLSSISRKYYKDWQKWNLIFDANKDKIKNPDLILPGWVLDIPLVVEEKKDEEVITVSTDVVVTSFNIVELSEEKDLVNKNSRKANEDEKQNYSIVEKNKINLNFPKNLAPFNISVKRIEVKKDFFDGEIIDDSKKFFIKGDRVKFKLYEDKTSYSYAHIYFVINEENENFIVEKIGECEIEIDESENLICFIVKSDMVVEKGMKIKLWK